MRSPLLAAALLAGLLAAGGCGRNGPAPLEVTVRVGDRVIIVFPEADIALGVAQDLPIESGYAAEGGAYRPFARYVRG